MAVVSRCRYIAKGVYVVAQYKKLRVFKIDNLSFSVEDFKYNNREMDKDGDLLHCPWEISSM